MADSKAVIRPALEYASSILSHLASSTSINKLQVMLNAALRTVTGWTQDANIQQLKTKHSYFPYTGTYSSTPHNTHRKHNIHHMPYTNIQLTPMPKTSSLTTAATQQTFPQTPTVTTTDIKTNMRYIHTYIVIATRCNNKILLTPPTQISSSEEILPRPTCRTLAQLRTNKSPFQKSYLHNVVAKSYSSPHIYIYIYIYTYMI